jgi:hypothetical protein
MRNAGFSALPAALLALGACSDATKTTDPAKASTPVIAAVSDLSQQGIVDRLVPSNPVVRVTDKAGNPLRGINVVFSDGTSQIPTVVTGADGLASTTWRLARFAGTQTMTAMLYSAAMTPLAAEVTFLATALPDTLAGVNPASTGSQTGFTAHAALVAPVVVTVDEFSNAKPGIDVTFEVTGGGSVTPSRVVSDAAGRATVNLWTLGSDVGVDTLIARVANLPPVYFTVRVGLPFAAKAIVSGEGNTCAISLDGDVYCWGSNAAGQVEPGELGGAFTVPQRVPLPAKAVSIASGYSHTCAISNESPPQAYCWGFNSNGQLGRSVARPSQPVKVPVPDGLASVTTGSAHSCGLTPAGIAYCWGLGSDGQLGTGSLSSCTVADNGFSSADCSGPQAVAGNLRFVSIAAGASHTCGLTTLAQVYCWGLNANGQLGAPSGSPCYDYSNDYYYYYYYGPQPVACAPAPQIVPAAPAYYTSLAAGFDTCALTGSGAVACYGASNANVLPQLDGSQIVGDAMPFTSLAPDGNCGIRLDGSAYCWTQEFDASSATFAHPAPIANGFAFSALTATQTHRCGIQQGSGAVLCWGTNDAGQLGNGTQSTSTAPSFVLPPQNP